MAQPRRQGLVGERSRQIAQQLGAGPIQNAMSVNAGLLPQSLNNVTLSDSAPTHQNQIGPAPDEIPRGQFFDLHPVEGFRIELPVEALQRFILRKARFSNPACYGAFATSVGLRAQQQVEKLKMGKVLFF